ncbi:MAG: hypothetical protein M4579_006378 [Chaenotheca gracillima]|nr:MAG: hypothetical protein M4579_006378 [Chaenotheca gracillima]
MAHTTFPSDIPVPKDDGACNHLQQAQTPDLALPIASDPSHPVNLSTLPGLTIVFIYPRTGAPGETVPDDWNAIPGARGCTPQACSFRDNFDELTKLGVTNLYGLSTQSSAYQKEVHDRLELPYELLSDETLAFQQALELPTFDWHGTKVIRRVTLALQDGKLVKWWYPIFPPDKNVDLVLEWLKERSVG